MHLGAMPILDNRTCLGIKGIFLFFSFLDHKSIRFKSRTVSVTKSSNGGRTDSEDNYSFHLYVCMR